MRADPAAALLYSDMIVVDDSGEEIRRSQIGPDFAHAHDGRDACAHLADHAEHGRDAA